MRRDGYLVLAVDGKWEATSIVNGATATDLCPLTALTECRTIERSNPGPKPPPQRTTPQLKTAVNLATFLVGLTFDEMATRYKVDAVVKRRAIAWYLLWHHGNGSHRVFSSKEIAAATGRSSHSTVQTACARVLLVTQMPEWAELLEKWDRVVSRCEYTSVSREPWFVRLLNAMGGPIHE